MLNNQRIALVIPVFNEERQLPRVLDSVPAYVDHIFVVDDGSTDGTAALIGDAADVRVTVLRHECNRGVGAAVATGYAAAVEAAADVAVVIDGDGQMSAEEMRSVIEPVLDGRADYVKGNRFAHGNAYSAMPKLRFFGNAVLSLLTKIVSGYWHVSDSQSGFTAIGKRALQSIDWQALFPRYGYPNDVLVKLNVEDFRVCDVPVTALYDIGEDSKLRPLRVFLPIAMLLLRLFFHRMWQKYVIRDFNPLVFFYAIGLLTGVASVLLTLRMCYVWWFVTGLIPKVNALAVFSGFLASAIFLLFAMWFDMTRNSHLR